MSRVTLVEVGPRDGLQNQPQFVATPDKIKLIDALSASGLTQIEVASFVSPKWVPQMADAAAVCAGIARDPAVKYSALTPNLRGFEAANEAGVDSVAVFASASEGFSQKNINCSIKESLERFFPIFDHSNVPIRGYVSCVVECPYDGLIAPDAVAEVTMHLLDMGCYEVSLGDTIGRATPQQVDRLLTCILAQIPAGKLAGHFHDTHGQALDNIDVALAAGIRVFDAAVGGLGGCPFAPGAAGNVATETVLAHLQDCGFDTGVDADALEQAAAIALEVKG
ncbi:hydroxymethylglutaryl-CoA lyase [Algirhabdus cladophorae]|uniref:hydroxymethylglutaryl-CoA lyase n=1 Tax=Algirhabdus cladophorae TaxID=3377108 RepID=UPI003B84AE44